MNIAEMFGVQSADDFDNQELAEGYLVGSKNAAEVHKIIMKEHGNKSRSFREGLLQALREQL